MIERIGAILIAIMLFSSALPVLAADVSIRPFLIDRTVEPRDVVTENITLTNDSAQKKIIFATVNEITVASDGEIKEFVSPVMTDRTNTITSWVEITRGRIELNPGESTEVPLTLRVHPYAKPGEYHVFIGFVAGSKRPTAEAIALAGDADGVIVKLTIDDSAEEFLRISRFMVDRFVIKDDQRVINIEVENKGDLPSTPSGEIIFYNSRGEEISSVVVNENNIEVPAGETATLSATVPFYNELGRYKANIALQYGEQQAAIYDTVQFYMLPMHIIAFLLIGIIVISLLIMLLFRRALHENDDEGEYDLPLTVRAGHEPNPKEHDIDLSNKN